MTIRGFASGFALLVASVAGTPAAALEPITTFARLPRYESPQLSPDGEHVIVKVAVEGVQLLASLGLFDDSAPTILPLGGSEALDWQWVNDEWFVVQLGREARYDANSVYSTRLIGVSRKTGATIPLGWDKGGFNHSLMWTARDGSPRILFRRAAAPGAAYPLPEVMEADVSTGKLRQAVGPREPILSFFADGQGIVRSGLGYSGENFVGKLIYRDGAGKDFRTADSVDVRDGDELPYPLVFLPEPGKALVSSSHNGFSGVYRYDMRTDKMGDPFFLIDGMDIGAPVLNRAGDALLGIGLADDRANTHWFDPYMAAVQRDIEKAAGAGKVSLESWSNDQTRFLVRIAGADQAGGYYYYDPQAGRMQFWAWANPELSARKLAPVSTIHYKTRDGFATTAVLTLPSGAASGKLPLIVLPHDQASGRSVERWDWMAQFLADRGYAVVQPNYRGSWGGGRAFARADLQQWGLAMQDDLLDAVAHLSGEGVVDPARVCIMGESFGGYMAMRASERDKASYRCAISYNGISDLEQQRRYNYGFLLKISNLRWLKRHSAQLDAVSPINHVPEIGIPLLLLHGRKDLEVPVIQSRWIAARLKAAGKPYRYVEQPEADHYFSREVDRLQFLQEVETFLKEHNPA